jgi:acetoin utilization deacetylase AcuC-like enzyme
MKKTGVFYHEVCGRDAYKPLVMGLEEGFKSLEKESIFSASNVILFESKPANEDWIAYIHTKNWIDYVKRKTGYWRCSLYSIGGIVEATKKVLNGEIDNAIVFAGVGGHHAHSDHAWGGCYFNLEAIAIEYARKHLNTKRFAVVDIDTHHANGTIDVFRNDEDVLYICFCGWWSEKEAEGKAKFCFSHVDSDEEFIEKVKEKVPPLIKEFKPEILYWVCGIDTHKASYGTQKLTEKCYPKIAKIIKQCADSVCKGRLIVMFYGNAPAWVCEYITPRIVDCLAELGKYEV